MFADGSVRFVKDSISQQTWYALGTKANGEVISSDSYSVRARWSWSSDRPPNARASKARLRTVLSRALPRRRCINESAVRFTFKALRRRSMRHRLGAKISHRLIDSDGSKE